MDDNSKSGYSIGYGKPPEETRFKPGRSGNPRGRPKNSRNYKTVMNKLLKERVKTEPLGWRQPNIKVVMQKLVDQALEGDWRALKPRRGIPFRTRLPFADVRALMPPAPSPRPL